MPTHTVYLRMSKEMKLRLITLKKRRSSDIVPPSITSICLVALDEYLTRNGIPASTNSTTPMPDQQAS